MTSDKVIAKYGAKPVTESHGHGPVRRGMFLEGTVHYGGVLPDIRVDDSAYDLIRERVHANCRDISDVERAIDCVEKVVRVLLPEQHPEKLAEFCRSKPIADRISKNEYVDLSEFLAAEIGDCRMNALSLGVGLSVLEERGLIKNVEFGNRKWGIARSEDGKPDEEVGHQGEHAICTFQYMGEKADRRYVADAYAVPYDRVPVGGKSGVDVLDDWYKVEEARRTGRAHNTYRQLLRDGTFHTDLRRHMSRVGAERFREQAALLAPGRDEDLWAYMSETLPHPKIVYVESEAEAEGEV